MKTKLVILFALALTALHSASFASHPDSRIVLRYSNSDKADLIEEGIFESSQFDGNEISVSAESAIDVNLLIDDETAPQSRCFVGTGAQGKKILEAMIELTDGNGEHYLEKMQVEATQNNKISANFTVKGPRGIRKHSISIDACRPSPQE